MPSFKPRCLDGIRVLDLTRILSGPYCTQILADHGAEVIKVERPGHGDDTRTFGPPFLAGEAAYYLSINRNKRSVVVDMKNDAGVEIIRDLARVSDVVVENFRPGTAARLGLGPEDLRALDPRLIYCSISGFGQSGPWKDRPGYDLAVQGLSGLQSITGSADGPPTKVGTSIADIVTGLYAAQGILLALFRRERTGHGETIDVAMLDSVVSLLTYQAGNYFATGLAPKRAGNRHPSIVPYQTFAGSDGYFNLAVGNDAIWARLCEAIERPDLAIEERYATNPDRVAHREELVQELETIFAAKPVAHWVTKLEVAAIPGGTIHDVGQVLELDVVRARQMVVQTDHPTAGPIRLTGVPVKLSEAPGAIRSAPPLLGDSTEDVLRDILGYDPALITSLMQDGVISKPDDPRR